jgi:hypothetical protein
MGGSVERRWGQMKEAISLRGWELEKEEEEEVEEVDVECSRTGGGGSEEEALWLVLLQLL